MKYLLFLLPFTALAIDPSAPVVRMDGANVVERQQRIPQRHGSTVNYQSAGAEAWRRDGWRQAAISRVTNSVVTAIPEPIQRVAAAYTEAMESIYGAGAPTNRELTAASVAIDLSLHTDVSADTGLRLRTWYEILNEYWGRGEIWSFPYGAESYTVESVEEIWEAAD
jgi:hypothetical protein